MGIHCGGKTVITTAQLYFKCSHRRIHLCIFATVSYTHLTDANHPTGTDRLAEVVAQRGWDDETIVVNVQGDEPLIDPELVAQVASQLASSGADIATLAHPITLAADFLNPNVVKVVCKANDDALYFSRAPIPYPRDHFAGDAGNDTLPSGIPAYRHIGLYA